MQSTPKQLNAIPNAPLSTVRVAAEISDRNRCQAVISAALTARQIVVLNAIENFIASHSFPPTREEIALRVGASRQAVEKQIRSLARKGFLAVDDRMRRGLRVLRSATSASLLTRPLAKTRHDQPFVKVVAR